jgi:hypothetical protein
MRSTLRRGMEEVYRTPTLLLYGCWQELTVAQCLSLSPY